jgi:hypothetical protein
VERKGRKKGSRKRQGRAGQGVKRATQAGGGGKGKHKGKKKRGKCPAEGRNTEN